MGSIRTIDRFARQAAEVIETLHESFEILGCNILDTGTLTVSYLADSKRYVIACTHDKVWLGICDDWAVSASSTLALAESMNRCINAKPELVG